MLSPREEQRNGPDDHHSEGKTIAQQIDNDGSIHKGAMQPWLS